MIKFFNQNIVWKPTDYDKKNRYIHYFFYLHLYVIDGGSLT